MHIKRIELLSPAKNLDCGIAAINHGADAVYIGAPKFSARAAAGNSITDIEKLVNYAHLYNAKVYIALNTILKNEELEETEKLIGQLYRAGSDALIIQDMGVLEMNLPPIPLHASTQMDNRTLEKVQFLEKSGFSQVVLARELSIQKIKHIASHTDVKLEAFIHGAICVSYSGQCYMSESCFKRSANRGDCAQLCRLPYTLSDTTGKRIIQNKHLLSMKDMNRSDFLLPMIEAGISSFKIEGRLKDIAYVKNVTAYYRKLLDSIFEENENYKPSSSGKCTFSFNPDPQKSFNRGFTDYFLVQQQQNNASFDTPKSVGEYVGKVVSSKKNQLVFSQKIPLNNGDGICFFSASGELFGCQINKVEGNTLLLNQQIAMPVGTPVYRNKDNQFEKMLLSKTSDRKIRIRIVVAEVSFGFAISAIDEDNNTVSVTFEYKKEEASTPQKNNVDAVFRKLGNTIFTAEDVAIEWQNDWFIPRSVLSSWKNLLVEKLYSVRKINYKFVTKKAREKGLDFPVQKLTYLGNVANNKAASFYNKAGVTEIEPAFEIKPANDVVLMFSKHCIKYCVGLCPKHEKKKTATDNHYKEPFFIHSGKLKFKLHFDCGKCEMEVVM